jgi:choline dehydrogenase-like flavoprotein
MSVIEGHTLDRDLDASAEVVVVGSGAGGAVVAKELAEAGIDVVVLEEGPHVPGSVYGRLRPTESLRRMGREAGTTPVLGIGDTPLITVMAGRVVGGSSVMTGGVCFRVPSSVHHRWVKERGLTMLSERDLLPAFEAVERESHVQTVPEEMRSLAAKKFVEGAARLEIPIKPFRRNTDGCCGCGRCNFGCPHGAKMSVDVTYLPKAMSAGARVYSDCLVDEIVTLGGSVRGVRGRRLGERSGKRQTVRGSFFVRAKTVVIAAGTMHSPQLLLRSGFRSEALGRHLTLHPSVRIVARFEEELKGWRGALQSVYSDHYEKEGITLNGLFVPPGALAATMPGVGRDFLERVSKIGHLAIFGGLIHDEGGGRVFSGIGREPFIVYRLHRANKAAMIRAIHILGEVYLAAGAREIYLPVFGAPPVRSVSDLYRLVTPQLSARKLECVTFHPLGTCRMALDARDGVVDPWGKSFELEGLYVADGSVVPTSIGVNSQLTIMAMAARIAWRIRDRLRDGRAGLVSSAVRRTRERFA